MSNAYRELVIEAGGSMRPGDTTGRYLSRIGDALDIDIFSMWKAWRGEYMSARTERKLRNQTEKRKNEARNTADRLEQIAQRLEVRDAEFHSQDIDALRALASRHRNRAIGKK